MNNKISVLILVLVGIAAAAFYFSDARMNKQVTPIVIEPVVCTQEAKLCPDGSSVGRTGANCAFAECPSMPVTQIKEGTVAALNQKILNNGILITPLSVVTDSRCPSDVVCISAGEVSLKVLLEKGTTRSEIVMKSQTPVVFGDAKVSLTTVTPLNNSKKTFSKDDYRLTFLVTPLPVAVATGTVSGTVTLSPICPVERIPQEPQCSPKPYATTIKIREEGKTTVVKTIQSNNLGVFATDLPVGSYELDAITADGSILPRCAKHTVLVTLGKNTVANISCDTGIR
ncbi:MAG: hypothetical protein WAW13_04085 [Minisyncoccia bacterium]